MTTTEPNNQRHINVNATSISLSPSAAQLFDSLDNGRDQLNERLSIHEAAFRAFKTLPRNDPMPGKVKYEKLLEDLRTNEAQWMAILDDNDNHRLAEKVIVVLGTLATIYRQSGHPTEAIAVLKVDGKILARYKEMEESMGSAFPFPGHSDELSFRYNGIRFGANAELRNADEAAKAFRIICDYEIRKECCGNPGQPTGNAAFMIGHVLGSKYRNLTLPKLAKLSDDELWSIVVKGMQLEVNARKDTDEELPPPYRNGPLAPQGCGLPSCDQVEKVVGEFKRCSRCHATLYCCRDHQREHWKVHKKNCNK